MSCSLKIMCVPMSDLELVSFINEENKRRKRRIIFIELYFEAVILGLVYLSSHRGPRDLGMHTLRKFLLKEMYDGSEVTCYDELRLTKRNFHDLCIMLRERCGLRESVYVTVEEKVVMFLLVVGFQVNNSLKLQKSYITCVILVLEMLWKELLVCGKKMGNYVFSKFL